VKNKKQNASSECPAKDCSGGTAQRQGALSEGQYEQLPEKVKAEATQNQSLKRCSYCGCVYSRNPDERIFGFLDNGVTSEKWINATS
tara:strand:+ start:2894 stop:3154 length:261 start_codon:yes stop_codon:yes gene_type:complete